jgi:phospholipid-binding lipoprotein MlaA
MKTVHFVILLTIFFNQPVFSAVIEHPSTQAVLSSAASENTSTKASAASEHAAALSAFPDLLAEDSTGESLTEQQQAEVYDPLEPMNRFFFEFNDRLYTWVLKPVTKGYTWVLPLEIRECVGNFFRNLRFPAIFLNTVLQGDLQASAVVVERFLINSTMGVFGLADVAASEFGIAPKRADLGETLGRWGIGEGIFLFWPVIGPSNARDTVGVVGDSFTEPLPYLHDNRFIDATIYTTNMVNSLSLRPGLYEDLKRYSLDPYVASRQGYTAHRRRLMTRE